MRGTNEGGTRRRTTAGTAAMLAAAALLAACAGGGAGTEPGPSAPPERSEPPATSSPTPSPTPSPSPSPSASAAPSGDAEAWQEVEFSSGTFSVPPGWELRTVGEGEAEAPQPLLARGYCPTDPHLVTGLVVVTWTDETDDAATAVATEVERAAQHFYPDRSPELTTDDVADQAPWATVMAGVALAPSDDPCDPTEAMLIIRGVPYPDGSGTFLYIVRGDLGLAESPAPDDLVGIANSLRL